MSKHKTIYIEIDDEVTSVAEKLRKAESEKVTIVIPKGAVLLQSIVNLKLLARLADKNKKKIAIVSADSASRNIVSRAGIAIQKSVNNPFPETDAEEGDDTAEEETETAGPEEISQQEKKHSDSIAVKEYRGAKGSEASMIFTHPKKEIKKKPLVPEAQKVEAPKTVKDRLDRVRAIKAKREAATKKVRLPKNFAKFAVLIAGVVGIIVFAILAIVLPKATITVIPQSEPASDTINVGVVTNGKANADINQINGKFIEMEKKESKSFLATGEKDFGDSAEASVSFSNAFSSSSESLAAGTKLRGSNGKIYTLDVSVTIPGAEVEDGDTVPGKITATATAEVAGDAYNSSSMSLVITTLPANKQAKITASTSGFKGGTTDMRKVVSKDDIAKAKEAFEPEVKKLAQDDLKAKVEKGQTLPDQAQAVNITESKTLVAEGAEAESFDYQVAAKAIGITYSEDEVKDIASIALESKLEGEKTLLDTDEGNFSLAAQNFNSEEKTLIVATKVEKKAIPNIDLAETPKELTGKTDSEIRGFFAKYSEIQSVSIDFWPFWVKKAPRNAEKITIILDTE